MEPGLKTWNHTRYTPRRVFAKLSPTPASVELDGVSLNFILHTHPGQVTFWFIIKKNPNYKTLMEDKLNGRQPRG